MHKYTLIWNGKEESHSLSEWAQITGIKLPTLWSRINHYHWPLEKVLQKEPNYGGKAARKYTLIWNGNEETHTLEEWEQITGLNDNTIWSRIHQRHWPPDMVLQRRNVYRVDSRKYTLIWNGNEETHTLREWEEISGISEKTIYSRVNYYHWPLDRVLLSPRSGRCEAEYTLIWNGNEETHTLEEWEQLTGIKKATIKQRISVYNWPIDMILQKNYKRKWYYDELFELNGEKKTLQEWADEAGVTVKCVRNKLLKGIPLKEALNIYEPGEKYRLLWNGKWEVHTLAEWESITGINSETIRYRIYRKKLNTRDILISVNDLRKYRNNNKFVAVWNGRREAHTATEWSMITGINYTTIISRRQKHWNEEKLLQPAKDKGCVKTYTLPWKGHEETHTLTEWTKITGIHPRTLSNRIAQGIPTEEILLRRRDKASRLLATERVQKAIVENNLDKNLVLRRIYKGQSLEEATEPRKKEGRLKLYEAFGKFHTLQEWAEIGGIEYRILKSRVQSHGQSVEEALSKVPHGKITYELNGTKYSTRTLAEKLGVTIIKILTWHKEGLTPEEMQEKANREKENDHE